MAETGPPLGKYLASTEKKTRDKAIKSLASFLQSSEGSLPKKEMDKLWKGVFYCFWMTDKPLVQQALATELADILLTISSTSVSLPFLRGFWQTTVREWNGIDRLRIDKYYMLVRRFVNASFRLLLRTQWDMKACEEHNDILTSAGGPLCPNSASVPPGLVYHLSDIYLTELDKAIAVSQDSTDETISPAPLSVLLQPILQLAARTSSSVSYKRIESALLQPLMEALSASASSSSTLKLKTANEDDEEDEDDGGRRTKRARISDGCDFPHLCTHMCFDGSNGGVSQSAGEVKKRLLKMIFDIASQEDTRDSNRRKLYKLWKEHADDDEDES